MRTTDVTMVAALLLIAAGAAAQDATTTDNAVQKDVAKTAPANSDLPLVNEVNFGVRGTSFGEGSDEARYQHYRDLRNGATFDRVRYFKETDAVKYNFQADNVGYKDQRFSASYMNFGKLKARQIPETRAKTTSSEGSIAKEIFS